MCHLVLALPILGIPVFWIFPYEISIPIYAIILVISLLIYYSMMKAMRIPVKNGSKGMIGQIGNVTRFSGKDKMVRVHSELWKAVSSDSLKIGDSIKVTAIKGLVLTVEKFTNY